MTRQQAINYLSNSGFSMIQVETIVRALSTLSEVDFKELKDRYGDEVEYVVRDMVSGENLRWVELPRPKKQEPTTKNDLGVDCISRKQAIDAFPDLLPNMGYNKKAITEILQDLPSVTPQEPRWIPVSERLPEANRAVLTYIDIVVSKTFCLAYWSDVSEAWEDWMSFDLIEKDRGYKVIAWMPLPSACERGNERMTREEAKPYIGELQMYAKSRGWDEEYLIACDVALNELEQEPVIDKIRAEIKALTSNRGFLSCDVDYIHEEIDAVFDKYKAETEVEE